MVSFGKLVLHPLAVLAMLLLLPPMDPVLAQKHHLEGFCAAALLATTIASFFSISAALWLRHTAL